jgi:hypothetical protein
LTACELQTSRKLGWRADISRWIFQMISGRLIRKCQWSERLGSETTSCEWTVETKIDIPRKSTHTLILCFHSAWLLNASRSFAYFLIFCVYVINDRVACLGNSTECRVVFLALARLRICVEDQPNTPFGCGRQFFVTPSVRVQSTFSKLLIGF